MSTQTLIDLYFVLKNSIWTPENINKAMSELEEEPPQRTRLYYFNPGYPADINGFLTKMGILNYDILIEDPLTFPLPMKPTFPDHILKNPNMYVQHMFENAVFMIYLEEWIKKGYVYFVPSLPMFDTPAFWELAKMSHNIFDNFKVEETIGFKKGLNLGLAEGTVRSVLQMLRLIQKNYTLDHIKRIFKTENDEEAQKILDNLKSGTLEQREKSALDFAISKHPLTDKERSWLQSQFLKSRPFSIERFLDVSHLSGSMMTSTGMPLMHASYISDRMQCVPATDHLGLMNSYEGWCQGLGRNLGDDFEQVRSKVELPFTFFDDVPLEFVQKAREQRKGIKTAAFLGQKWSEIRTAKDLDSYKTASIKFSENVSDDYQNLKMENEALKDELSADIIQTAALGGAALVGGQIITEIPLAIAASLLTTMASGAGTLKNYRKNKHSIESKPLAVFVSAEDSARPRKPK